MNRDVGTAFRNRLDGSQHGLPSFAASPLDHGGAEEAQLRSVAITEGLEIIRRAGHDDRVDLFPLGERFDRPEKHRTASEVSGKFVAGTKSVSDAGGGNDDGDSHE